MSQAVDMIVSAIANSRREQLSIFGIRKASEQLAKLEVGSITRSVLEGIADGRLTIHRLESGGLVVRVAQAEQEGS